MYVKLGKYCNFIGPYQIAEKILFWMDKHKDDRVHNLGKWLAENKDGSDSWLTKVCQWVNSKKKRKVVVKLDPWDTWSMDSTLAIIILPMLRQLKDKQHGAGGVDDIDVPEHLRRSSAPPVEEHDTDMFWFARWEYVMNELIWTFEQLQPDNDWEDQYHSGQHDIEWKEIDETMHNLLTNREEKLLRLHYGPNHTHTFDKEGWEKHNNRINNGLKLFGKYFRNLWD